MKQPKSRFRNAKQSTLPYSRTVIPSKISKAETLITNYVIDSLSPLSTVQNPAFRKLIFGLYEEAHIPDRKKLKGIIDKQYNDKVFSLTKKLSEVQHYCLTADIWSARNRSFLGMTVHWMSPNFERQSAVLALKRFTGTHDGDSIAEMLLRVFEQFGISLEKVTCMVTDNGSNFVKAFKDYGVQFDDGSSVDEDNDKDPIMVEFPNPGPLLPFHKRCASHTLSLAATTDLDNANIVTPRGQENFKRVFRSAMAKCSAVWNSVSRSPKTFETVTKICGKSIIRPVIVRWNSTFDAIRRLIELKEKLPEICRAVDAHCLTTTEVECLEQYLNAMQPVAFALDKLQGENKFYYGYYAPVILETLKKLNSIVDQKNKFSAPIAKVLKEAIEKRFSNICNLQIPSAQTEILAAISLPYFKLRWIPPDKQEELKNAFVAAAKTFAPTVDIVDQQPNSASSRKDDQFFDFDNSEVSPQSEVTMTNAIELECLQFFQNSSKDMNSLDLYPTVKQMFLKYNTSLASSAPVEREFSYAGMILSPKRSQISDQLLEQLVTLKVDF